MYLVFGHDYLIVTVIFNGPAHSLICSTTFVFPVDFVHPLSSSLLQDSSCSNGSPHSRIMRSFLLMLAAVSGAAQSPIRERPGAPLRRWLQEDRSEQSWAECAIKTLAYFRADILEGMMETAVGDAFVYPVRDPRTNETVGVYKDAATFLGDRGECIFTGSYNFHENEFGRFQAQILVAGRCHDTGLTITGGTGKYAGASGVIFFDFDVDRRPMVFLDMILSPSTCTSCTSL